MSFENNQMLERVSASGTSMRTFSHMFDSNVTFHHTFPVEMRVTQVACKSTFFLVSPFNMLLKIVIDGSFVATYMTNFKIAFLGMTITYMLLKTFLQRMSVITLITFPRLLGFVLVHNVLLDVFEILSAMWTKSAFLFANSRKFTFGIFRKGYFDFDSLAI